MIVQSQQRIKLPGCEPICESTHLLSIVTPLRKRVCEQKGAYETLGPGGRATMLGILPVVQKARPAKGLIDHVIFSCSPYLGRDYLKVAENVKFSDLLKTI